MSLDVVFSDCIDHTDLDTAYAVQDVVEEVSRAAEKHGDHADPRNSDLTLDDWLFIRSEEYGEVEKERTEMIFTRRDGLDLSERLRNIYDELSQEAAMCLKTMAWLRWKGLVK